MKNFHKFRKISPPKKTSSIKLIIPMQKLQCHWTKIKQTTRNSTVTVTSPSMRLTSIGQLVNGPWTRLESWFLKSLFQGFFYAQSKAFRRQRWYYSSRERWKWKLYLFCMAKSKAWVLSHIGMYRKKNKFELEN